MFRALIHVYPRPDTMRLYLRQSLIQTSLSNDEETVFGNCMATCFACIAGDRIEDWPDINVDEIRQNWFEVFSNAWLERGAKITRESIGNGLAAPDGIAFAYGLTSRHPTRQHLVVILNGTLLWDPHPDQTGLTEVLGYYELIPREHRAPSLCWCNPMVEIRCEQTNNRITVEASDSRVAHALIIASKHIVPALWLE